MPSNPKLNSAFPFAYILTPPETPTRGREPEIGACLDVLWKTRMRNLIVAGPAGCGKTHLVRAVSALAPGHVFYGISCAGLVAGMKYVGDFEKRVSELVSHALLEQKTNHCRVVLFLDEIHTIVGAGSTRGERYELDLAQILKPTLSDGRLAIWGATTTAELGESISRDGALLRRFDIIRLEPLTRGYSCISDEISGS